MVRQLKYNLEIVGCSIVREEDGLALSSRNKRLSAEERENALNISRTLFKSRNFAATHTVSETQKMVEDAIEAAPGLRMEYFVDCRRKHIARKLVIGKILPMQLDASQCSVEKSG